MDAVHHRRDLKLLVLANVTNTEQTVDLTQWGGVEFTMDRLVRPGRVESEV